MTTDYHRCACCTKPIRPGLLMCMRHWRLVPADLQRRVNRAWRTYERYTGRGQKTLALCDYRTVREAAIKAVLAQLDDEGKA